jgi:hypothetical protein
MGDKYEGKLECPYCKKKTYFHYAPSCEIFSGECEYCKKEFEIVMSFKGVKIDNKKKKKSSPKTL